MTLTYLNGVLNWKISIYLQDLSDKAILSQYEQKSINTSIATIKKKLDSYFGDKIQEQFIFGSCTRGTILPHTMDNESDVDYMIVFNDHIKPQTHLNHLKDFVKSSYPRSDTQQSHPTIQLELNHIHFDLVPALRLDQGVYKIPARKNHSNEWVETNPNDFNNILDRKDRENDYLIRPLIRIIKYLNVRSGGIDESFKLEKDIIATDFSHIHSRDIKDYVFYYLRQFNNNHPFINELIGLLTSQKLCTADNAREYLDEFRKVAPLRHALIDC